MKFTEIPVNKVTKKGRQPRQNFDRDALNQLVNSIKQLGQLQPIIVQKQKGKYLLIAGERRLRAVKETGKEKIAAMIIERELTDFTIQQMQLVENLHREDLDPLERAIFINNFIEQNSLTKKEAANKLGIPRTTITEWLNILDVKPRYQQAVLDNDSSITLSHITLANNLANVTGDPTKNSQLLDGVVKYNLTRRESRYILDLYAKHLHLPMEEAISTVLIRREREKHSNTNIKKGENKYRNKISNLIKLFNNTGEKLEKVMESTAELDKKNKEKVIDEFLYIYQLLEILIPEIKNLNKNELISKLRDETLL